ncbi:putative bactericidal permeability-increasing protein [Rosellinia necatrix]|uniref:Putative bactericidal permeability-increasing protein n=1 Tax=Rosellinia necatrix TaxID=77044 RepID=A0A1W2TIQ9_ROSNE|nr:putative bactericidal permeability-increasing protein [Rosellinia necatrix]
MMFSSCFGWCRRDGDPEQQPLLPQYEQDTHLQRELARKLHSYQMCRALSKGYMPGNEQLIVTLRTLMASHALQSDNPDLSGSSRRLVRLTKQWLQQFIVLLHNKNSEDQLQDLIWFLTKSRIFVDVDHLSARARDAKAKADTAAVYESLRTVGSLLLTNPEFRTFLGDLTVVGREVFKDSAFALRDAADQAADQIKPSLETQDGVIHQDAAAEPPSVEELENQIQDVTKVVASSGGDVAGAVATSAKDKLSGDEGRGLLKHLQATVLNLRKRKDYSDSVSTLTLLLKRYALVYSRAAEELVETAQSDVSENRETDRALINLWGFVKSFGDRKEWEKCEELLKKVMQHKNQDTELEDLMRQVGDSLQELLTDPDFFAGAEEKINHLREKSKQAGSGSSLGHDLDELLQQLSITLQCVLRDTDVHNLITTTTRILGVLSPTDLATNSDLVQDSLNVFIPLLVAGIQYVPIPRLEVSTPAIDLLLENLIVEPGTTVNQTSFLPYRLKIETYNDVEIRKARFGTNSSSKHLVLIKIDGLSARADEVGFWLRTHSGIFRFADEGIASFALDERGIDIHLEVEICRERLEQILTLRGVRVRIHKLSYKLRKSKLSWIGWLIRPILQPLLKSTLEAQLASAIADLLHAGNRELLYARERLRATRIASPDDLWTFLKAVAARLVPEEDPDLRTRVGVDQPGSGVFRGVYAPGSVVKLWHEEAEMAGDRVEEFEAGGWRNDIFDTHVRNFT